MLLRGMIPNTWLYGDCLIPYGLYPGFIKCLLSAYNDEILRNAISLIESAKIDGYNDIAILFKIVVPLSGAMLSSIALFYAVATWNSYLGALIYISDRKKMVLQVVIRSLFMSNLLEEAGMESQISTPEHFRMSAIIITIFPVLLIYPYIQRYFIKGVQLGSIKG